MENIECDQDNPYFVSVDGVLYNKDMAELVSVPMGMWISQFIFPESVMRIRPHAFDGNEFLEKISIPNHVTDLGEYAFHACYGLKSVTLGKGVTEIKEGVFAACTELKRVTIKGEVTSIGEEAFNYCGNLKEINLPSSLRTIGWWAFYTSGLESVTIPESVVQIDREALGYGESWECPNFTIRGVYGTAAQKYAKENQFVFVNIKTGNKIRYDLIRITQEKIKKLTAGKRQFKVTYEKIEKADYQIVVKEAGASSWKKYTASGTSKVIRSLKAGKKYKVKVRARRKIDGKQYFGEWSDIGSVTVL